MKTTKFFTSALQSSRCLLFTFVSASLFATQARLSAADVSVPIKGSGTSAYVAVISPNGAEAHGEHRAIISHLGRVVGVSISRVNPPIPGFKVEPLKFRAANGDEVHAVGAGRAVGPDPRDPNRLLIEIDLSIIGGTGRFENASGQLQWISSRVQTNQMPPTFQDFFEISGRISTVGSNK